MSRPQRLARYDTEEAARFILQMEDDSHVETAEDPNYSESEDDGESDHVEADNDHRVLMTLQIVLQILLLILL